MITEIPLQIGWDNHDAKHLYSFPNAINFPEIPFHVAGNIVFTDLSNNEFGLESDKDFGQIHGAIDQRNGKKYLVKQETLEFLKTLHGRSGSEAEEIIRGNPDLVSKVVRVGLIIPENAMQRSKRERMYNDDNGTLHFGTLNEWIVLNKDCSSACGFCFAGQAHPEKKELLKDIPHRMPTHVMERIVKDMPHSAEKIGATHMHLKFGGGGEPAQATDQLFEFLDIVDRDLPKELSYAWVLITSGIGLTDTKLEEIKRRKGYIALSVGGDREGHNLSRPLASGKGSFDIVMNQLKRIKKHEIPHNLTMALTRANVSTAYRLLEMMYEDPEIGWSPVITSIVRDNMHAEGSDFVPDNKSIVEGYRAFLATMLQGSIRFHEPIPPDFDYIKVGPQKLNTCIAGQNYLTAASVIDSNNRNVIRPLISPCHVNATDTQRASMPSGDTYLTIAKSKFLPYSTYKRSMVRGEVTGCHSCDISGWCAGIGESGGCAIQKHDHGTLKPPYCEAYADATELLVQAILLSDLYNGFTPVI